MAKKKQAGGCDCAVEVNKALERDGSNTRLSLGWSMNLDSGQMAPPKPVLEVKKADKKIRKRCSQIVPTYCPFCGKKYDTTDSDPAV